MGAVFWTLFLGVGLVFGRLVCAFLLVIYVFFFRFFVSGDADYPEMFDGRGQVQLFFAAVASR